MELQTILSSFRDLCNMPIAWAILGVVGARALWSLIVFFRCPFLRDTDAMDPLEARAQSESLYLKSPRFLATMVSGLALSIGGLYALRAPDVGPLALAAIVFGVFLLIVEPSRLAIEENTRRVAASRLEGEDAHSFAVERLRASHIERVATEILMAVVLISVMLVY
jgi:hypothetical protein